MDVGLVVALGAIAAIIAVDVAVVGGTIDALTQPREAWTRAGARRSRWIWQAFGVFFLPAALVYSGLYYVRIRPRLVAAARDVAVETAPIRYRTQPFTQADGRPLPDSYKIRMPWSVAAAVALLPVVGYVVGFGVITVATDFASPPWDMLIGCGSAALLIAPINLGFGVTLTLDNLVMRGFTRRRIAWSDVVAITDERNLGTRYAKLWTRTGRSRRLRAPYTQLGVGRRQYERDFRILEQWWLTQISPAA